MEKDDLGYQYKEDKAFFDFLDSAEEQLELEVLFGAMVPHHVILNRGSPLDMREKDFISQHGLSKFAFRKLLDMTLGKLDGKDPTNPRHMPPALKLSALLQFLRSNSLYHYIGGNQNLRMSKSSVCRYVHTGAKVFANLQADYVKFPDLAESREIAMELSASGFPPVACGIIDGTHVEIKKPRGHEGHYPAPEKFFNRKGYYSFNLMCVVNHRHKIRHFTSSHAGSAHDSRIFEESFLCAKLRERFNAREPLALLGDEGYACSDVMLTPFRRQQLQSTTQEEKARMMAYNKTHKTTRLQVEHTFGILKKRFPALLYMLRCDKLDVAQAIIASAIVIHNILVDLKEPLAIPDGDMDDPDFKEKLQRMDMGEEHAKDGQEKFRLRNHIANRFF